MLHEYIKDNFGSACDLQGKFDYDGPMLQGYKKNTLSSDIVESWMRKYSLFRGISKDNSILIAESFVKLSQASEFRSFNLSKTEDLGRAFELILTTFNQQIPRNWISAGSNLLWCVNPNSIVIYDNYVYRCLSVIGKLHAGLEACDVLGNPPTSKGIKYKPQASVDFYLRYYWVFHKLFENYKGLISDLKQQNQTKYKYDIRLFDKLLWMLGSPAHDTKK